jgi:hypothetical protein
MSALYVFIGFVVVVYAYSIVEILWQEWRNRWH